MGTTAVKVPKTDHHTICKFEDKFGAYRYALDGLEKIRRELFTRNVEAPAGGNNV
jgi:hypothetical protein